MKKAIYSVVTGGYDSINVAPRFDGWDSILFTDQDAEGLGWEVRTLETDSNPLIQSRDIKIRSHIHLPEYDLVCYMDGNQKLLKPPPNEPTWFMHVRRKDIFEEAKQLIINGRFPANLINEQIEFYKYNDYEDSGLYLNGFFVREHTKDINELHDIWFEETCRFVPRDQLTLPFAIYRTGIFPENITSARYKEQFAIVKQAHKQNYASTPHHSRLI